MAKFETVPGVKETIPDIDMIEHGDLVNLIDNDLRHLVVDGRIILQGAEGELLGYNAIYESMFVNNWIAQFAIDEVNGRQYFNRQSWSDMTNKMVDGMIVVEDGTNMPLFIIPSFIRPQLSPDGSATLSFYASKASNAKHIVDKYQQTQFINNFARRVGEIIDAEPDQEYGLTRLVPKWFYEKHDIIPDAMKAMIYIRDVFGTVDVDSPEYHKAEEIFKKHYTGKPVSLVEREFIFNITKGAFNFSDGVTAETEDKPAPVKLSSSYNPLED